MPMPPPIYELAEEVPRTGSDRPSSAPHRIVWGDWAGRFLASAFCLLHGAAVWAGMGGRDGIAGEWPILIADHGFHYHHGLVTREFLRSTGMSAGYDPSFMSGYPMSVVTGTSSTLNNLAILAFGGDRPAVAFKLYTLLSVAGLPWIISLAAAWFGARPPAAAFSVLLYLVYFWTAFPVAYAGFGMTSFLISVPVSLLATAILADYLARGGAGRWILASSACSVVFLIHLTSALVVGPAGLLAYLVALGRTRARAEASPSGGISDWSRSHRSC